MFRLILFAYLLHLKSFVDGWSIVTSHPVNQPEPRLMSFDEVIDKQDVYRLNDRQMGLTAYKDKRLLSCFVNDYDPYWQPEPDDKIYLLNSQPCEKVNVTTDFTTLKKKAGQKIANMCKELYIFWLAARNMAPPPLPGMVNLQTKPCRIKYDDDLSRVPLELGNSEDSEQMGRSGNGGPAQALDGGAPPMIQDGAPPMIQDGAPPMIQDGAPPMIQDGAPPMMGDGAPPMLHDGAPPMLLDGAPPMIQDGAPPMFKDGEMRAPPSLENTHSRRDLDAPSDIKTPPPLKLPAALTVKPSREPEEKTPAMSPFWREIARQIKDTVTIAPPPPDMKTPPPPPAMFRRNMKR